MTSPQNRNAAPTLSARAGRRLFWLPRPWPLQVVLVGIMITCVRLQFVGSPSYTPILFAQLYILIFTFAFVLMPMLVTSDIPSSSIYVIGPVGFVAAWFASRVAPTIGEKNVCTMIASSWHTTPHIFHCTSLPYGLVAFALVWWLGVVVVERCIANKA